MKAINTPTGLIYASDFMYLKSVGEWLSNPTAELLAENGYKEVIYQEADEDGIAETETEIIILQKRPEIIEPEISELDLLREQNLIVQEILANE